MFVRSLTIRSVKNKSVLSYVSEPNDFGKLVTGLRLWHGSIGREDNDSLFVYNSHLLSDVLSNVSLIRRPKPFCNTSYIALGDTPYVFEDKATPLRVKIWTVVEIKKRLKDIVEPFGKKIITMYYTGSAINYNLGDEPNDIWQKV